MSGKTIKEKHVQQKGVQVIRIMVEGMGYFGKNSLYYSQETWLKRLKESEGREISRRQLNRDFADLENAGIIKRYKRHKKDGKKGWVFKSTRIYIAAKGWLLAVFHGLISWVNYYKRVGAIKKGGQRKVKRVEWGEGIKKASRPAWVKTKEQWEKWKASLQPEPT
ncbi:hypothetical protein ES703_74877 [subsurface metagenome]